MNYDLLYKSRDNNILRGENPGRLVKKITEYISTGKVLDIGCGDGKNALYLEHKGFDVVGFDSSSFAIQGLNNRFEINHTMPKGKYMTESIKNFTSDDHFDAIISYGVYHCLDTKNRITINKIIQDCLKQGGYLFFTCLTDTLPLPSNHGTEKLVLVNKSEIKESLKGYNIVYQENGIIKENHLPVIGEHQHSAIWIIAKKL